MEELALKASLSSPSDSKEYRGMLSEIEDHNFRNRQSVSERRAAFPGRSADKRGLRATGAGGSVCQSQSGV